MFSLAVVGGVHHAMNTCQFENTENDEEKEIVHSPSQTLFYIPTGKNPRWLLRLSTFGKL